MQNVILDKELRENMKKSEQEVSKYFSKERYCKDLNKYLEGKC